MKNLKKVLSLVMACAMAMSLMATAIAADKDFSDKAEIKNTEAVDVMTAMGVMQGNNGKFDPEGTLTREQAAKIITYMMLGKKDADKLTAAVAPYADVAADRWSAGAIAYCTNERIMVGNGKGKFNPTAKLTGQQFAKTLLVALGYDPKNENLEGKAWAVNASKMAVTTGLADGIGALSIPMSRDNAARMAFNALTATLVEYQGGAEVNTPDGTNVTVGAVRFDVKNTDTQKQYDGNDDDLMQFCERYQPDLKKSSVADGDDFGRAASKWIFDGKAVGTYADKATIVYTKEMKEADVKADIKDYNNYKGSVNVYTDGNTPATKTLNEKEIAALTGNGVQVEIFVDKNGVTSVAVINTYIGEVTSVNKTDEELTITYNGTTVRTTEGYNTFKKDDMVLFTMSKKNGTTVKDIVAAKKVTGKATSKNTEKGTITVDGTTYDVAKNMDTSKNLANLAVSGKDDATLYLDQFGYVIYAESGKESTSDKAVAIVDSYNTMNKDGKIVPMIKGVTSNGETVTWEVKTAPADGDIGDIKKYTEKDGVYTLEALDGAVNADKVVVAAKTDAKGMDTNTKKLSIGGTAYYFTNDLKTIFVDKDSVSKKVTTTVLDGAQKVDGTKDVVAVIKEIDGKYYINTLYVKAAPKNTTATSDDLVFVVGNPTGSTSVLDKDGHAKTFNTYNAYINGKKVDNFYSKDNVATSGFYTIEISNDTKDYVLTGNEYKKTDLTLSVSAEITVADIVNNSVLTDNTDDYSITNATFVDTTKDGSIDSAVALKDAINDKKTVKVMVVYNHEDMKASYVYVTSAETTPAPAPSNDASITKIDAIGSLAGHVTFAISGETITLDGDKKDAATINKADGVIDTAVVTITFGNAKAKAVVKTSGDALKGAGALVADDKIVVTAEDGTTKEYNIKIAATKSSDATITAIVAKGTLTDVNFVVTDGAITVKGNNRAAATINKADGVIDTAVVTITFGNAKAKAVVKTSGDVLKGATALVTGDKIVVTAEDGTPKDYTITVEA